MAASKRAFSWKFVRALTPPVLVLAVLVGWLVYTLLIRVEWWQRSDEYNLREWLNESRVSDRTLPELLREYLQTRDPIKGAEIAQQLDALGSQTHMYQGQLPLFWEIYRLEIRFADRLSPPVPPIVWEYDAPQASQAQTLEYWLLGEKDDRAVLQVRYQLHPYKKR